MCRFFFVAERATLAASLNSGLICIALAAGVFASKDGLAAESAPLSSRAHEIMPYQCGIYSLYGALRSVAIPCDIHDLLQPKFMTSADGSTIADLMTAAKSQGAFALARTKMTADDLRDVSCPVILHVANERRIGTYDHWVLYLGVERGMARIVDSPHDVELIPFAQLLACWDSTGILVSKDPIELTSFQIRRLLLVTLMASTVIVLPVIGARLRPLCAKLSLGAQLAFVCLVSVILGVAFHAFAAEGMLRNNRAVELVQQSKATRDFPEVSIEELTELIRTNEVTVVDSRFGHAFAQGGIPGAINIPLNTSADERQRLLSVKCFTGSGTESGVG